MNVAYSSGQELSAQPPSRRYPGFQSFKTKKAIPYPRRWHRDLLLLNTFDPLVLAMEPHSLPERDIPATLEFAFKTNHAEKGRALVIVGDAWPSGLVAGAVEVIVSVTRGNMHYHPHLELVRSIWSKKRLTLDPGDRYRLISEVAANDEGRALGDLIAICRSDHLDPVHQILCLVANGYLQFDLNKGLAADTQIRTCNPSFTEPSLKDSQSRCPEIGDVRAT